MTNRIAIGLALALALGIGLDLALNDGQALTFLARKFLGLVDWATFWR
jgi:hypothetical protein